MAGKRDQTLNKKKQGPKDPAFFGVLLIDQINIFFNLIGQLLTLEDYIYWLSNFVLY